MKHIALLDLAMYCTPFYHEIFSPAQLGCDLVTVTITVGYMMLYKASACVMLLESYILIFMMEQYSKKSTWCMP